MAEIVRKALRQAGQQYTTDDIGTKHFEKELAAQLQPTE